MATIKDVARLAGVSTATVSRYFSRRSLLKESTAVKIAKAIEETEFIPNNNARNLKLGKTKTIGLVVPDITLNLFCTVAQALNEIFFNNGYSILIYDSGYKPERERANIISLLEHGADLILVATVGENTAFLNTISEKYHNLLLFDRLVPEVKADCICENNRENGKKLGERIIKELPRDFVILTGPMISPITKLRMEGLTEAFRENGIDPQSIPVLSEICSQEAGYKAISPIIKEGHFPKTVIFFNQNCLMGVMQNCWEKNIRINKDIFIAGFSTLSLRKQFNLPSICVIQDAYQLGLTLGDYCLKKLSALAKKTNQKPKTIFVETKIVEE